MTQSSSDPWRTDDLRAIVDLQLARVMGLAAELGVTLEVSPEARDIIASEGHDPAFGARPLKRAIQRMVQDPLALKLLEAEISEGTVVRAVPGETPGRWTSKWRRGGLVRGRGRDAS